MQEFTFDLAPIGTRRPRFSMRNGKARVYDTQSSIKAILKMSAKSQMAKFRTEMGIPGVFMVEMTFHMSKPKTTQRRPVKMRNQIYHDKKFDIDNMIKFYLDVLNGIAYQDDRMVAVINAEKIYADHPCVKIKVYTLEEEGFK